jgi:hypothetical protein
MLSILSRSASVAFGCSLFAVTTLAQAASLPLTDYQDIRKLDLAKQAQPCPTDTVLLRWAESRSFKVQICSKAGDLSLPGYYMGNAKKGGSKLKFQITDQPAAQQGVYQNADYTYVIYTDGLHRDGFRPKLQVYGPKAKLLLEEQLLALYDKDFRPRPSSLSTAATVDLLSMLPQLKATKIPILLPSRFTLTHNRPIALFASADANSYSIGLAVSPDCGGANACTVGSISGELVKPGTELPFATIVPLANGIEGSFKPLTCGGSCSPPEITWIQNDVQYSIQLKGVTTKTDDASVQAVFVKLANLAIQAGPR